MENTLDIRIFGTVNDTIVDGPGLRFGVFVQGCSWHCKGCHNPESWAPDGGQLRTTKSILEEIHANKLVKNVTLSGGDPFQQAKACALLAEQLKAEGYNIWCYTGAIYEDLQKESAINKDVEKLLGNIDVLVDGPYIEELHSMDIPWRGSTNQRLIDIPKSLKQNKLVLWEPKTFVQKKPSNW